MWLFAGAQTALCSGNCASHWRQRAAFRTAPARRHTRRLLEARGDVEAAAEGLERANAMHAAWQPHSREQRRLAIVAAGHHRAGRWAEKLETLKALLAMLPP